MTKYRRRSHSIVEEPGFFLKHWFYGFLSWADDNREQFITALVAVLVIIAAGLLWLRHVQTRELRAWQEFAMPENVASLEAAADSFSGTSAGPFLKLKLADMLLAHTDSSGAAEAYGAAARRTDGHEKRRALYSRARAFEDTGRFDEAGDIYSQLAEGQDFWATLGDKALGQLEANRQAHERVERLRTAAEAARAAEPAVDEAPEQDELRLPPVEDNDEGHARPVDQGADRAE